MSRLASLVTAAAAAAFVTLGVASTASATTYSLWVHGRNTDRNTQTGNYNDWTYWGPGSTAAGANKRSVNWDGVSHLAVANVGIRAALDRYCTGANWCNVATHSTGGPMIGYALALWGGSTRSVHDAASGTATGATQTGWNINWIDDGASAAGGTELADLGYWAVSDYITNDLRTGVVRSMYDHNQTRGRYRYMFAGASGTLYSGALPGQDDEVVAYHSAGGVNYANIDGSYTQTGSYCNPGDWFCDTTLSTGTSSMGWSWSCGFLWLSTCYGNAYKFSNHTVYFRDSSESYNHYTSGNWGGITSQVRNDMVTYSTGAEVPDTSSAVVASCSIESCSHSPNATGAALTYSPGVNNSSAAAACSPCAQRVCERDSYCCTYSWDSICVSEAQSWCGCAAPKTTTTVATTSSLSAL
ncbi:MAG: hypothetical protein U0165_07975 [Polyangiaceae bacterium]